MNSLMQHLLAKSACPILDQRLPAEKRADESWYVGQSDIAGDGVFAGRPFEAGETVDVSMTAGDEDPWGAKIWNLTLLSQKCNHQNDANVKIQKVGDRFDLVTIRPVDQDEELTADYRQVTRAIGPHSRMQWQGEDIPSSDLEDFVENDNDNENS